MADPEEGVAADGTIRTGASRSRVPPAFEPVLADAAALAGERGASLYVYGSVANGTVRPGSSDVDLLSADLRDAAAVGRLLSARYAGLCRASRSQPPGQGTWPEIPTPPTASGSSCGTTAST
jgi:uncharacterized protein